jgi:hypothetical protein
VHIAPAGGMRLLVHGVREGRTATEKSVDGGWTIAGAAHAYRFPVLTRHRSSL